MLWIFVIIFIAGAIHPSHQRRQTFKCNDYVTESTSYHRSGIAFKMGPHYVCYLSNVIQHSGHVEIVDHIISHANVNGMYGMIEPREVGAIVVKNSNFILLPSALFHKFRNLLVFRASDVSLRGISREDFRDAEHLTILHLDRNDIVELEDGVFSYLKRLQRLDLSRNQITAINEMTFSGVSSDLYEVDLSYNRLSELDFSTLIPLAHSRKLSVELNLNYNEIKEVRESHRVPHLAFEALLLKSNLLESFTCPDMRIGELHLEDNRLKVVSFDNCSVEYLIASHNHLNWLHIHSDLKGFVAAKNQINSFVVSGDGDSEVYHFDLSDNQDVSHVWPSLRRMPEMQFLNLSHSYVGLLEENAFADMKELKYVLLKNTGLESLPYDIFANNKFLWTIDLSDNALETIDLTMFTGLNRLRILDLSGNKLAKLHGFERVRTILPELSEIGIAGNRFECHDLSVIIRTFEALGINVVVPQFTGHHHYGKKTIDGIPCY